MDSFRRLLEIYPSTFSEAEHAQTFLWYHLRANPDKRTAHLKEIQKYFRRADKKVPSIETLRAAFTGKVSSYYPVGTKEDTYGIDPSYMWWWDHYFGSCFEESEGSSTPSQKNKLFRRDLSVALPSLKAQHPSAPSTEVELHSLVLSAIDEVLVHHFETRRLIDFFWDDSRKIKHNGQEIKIPKEPKNETKILRTLHVFLQYALEPFGVHVIRETDEGSGSLDFRFSTTNANSELISIAAEFKLAHHKEVKAGVSRQLPRYMDSIPCSHGVFILMWFKDEDSKYFKEPKSRNLEDTREFVSNLASNPNNAAHVIATRVIDCSVRPSASKLR